MFVESVNRNFEDRWKSEASSFGIQFLAHGHLGEMVLWAGVAKILKSHNVSDETAEEVAFGRTQERERFWQNWLVGKEGPHCEPLPRILELLASGQPSS